MYPMTTPYGSYLRKYQGIRYSGSNKCPWVLDRGYSHYGCFLLDMVLGIMEVIIDAVSKEGWCNFLWKLSKETTKMEEATDEPRAEDFIRTNQPLA